MKPGDVVYRKAAYRVVAITEEKNEAGSVTQTHLSLTSAEPEQYINCMLSDVEVPEAPAA